MDNRIRQCVFVGERRGQFMGRTTTELARCLVREEEPGQFWRDPELDDPYCPRHEKLIKRRA